MLDFVDDTLESATRAGKKASSDADKKFEMAIQMLNDYQMEYHPTRPISNLCDMMAKARENDQSSLTILNRLKETFRVREKFAPSVGRYFEFLIRPIPSQLKPNRRGQSSFLSTSPFLIGALPV